MNGSSEPAQAALVGRPTTIPVTALRPELTRDDSAGSKINEIDCVPSAPRGSTSNTTAGIPRVVVDEREFDFGRMDPLQRRQHTFVIRNEGTAPLKIQQGATSCKCTLGEIANGTIPPGGQTTATLTWTTSGQKSELFAQEAEIFTNDPDNEYLLLRIRGEIRSKLKMDPALFAMPDIAPDAPLQSTVTITSQLWDDFVISHVESSVPNLTWIVTPIEQEAAAQLDVKSGYRLTIQAPNDFPRGQFSHWLRMQITPDGGEPTDYEIPVQGNVLRRVSIYGNGIDSTGTIKLGKVRQGEGLKRYFLVKVRDQDPELELDSVVTDPDFLQVRFIPNEKVDRPGLYRMLVEIPKTAPPAVYMGQRGAVRVVFSNPRFEDLDLSVEFAVLGERDF